MSINFILKDFEENTKEFVLENPDTVEYIIYTVLCGDEVIFVQRSGELEPEVYDSYNRPRMYSSVDKIRVITLEELGRLNRD